MTATPDLTIPALFFRQAESRAGHTLFLAKQGGAYRPISWRQAADDVAALRSFLLDRRVQAGDRVVILSENRPEWAVADLAIQSAGAWAVPLYPTLSLNDLRAICQDCQPVAAVASSPEHAALLAEVQRQVPSLRTIIAIQPCAPHSAIASWAAALEQGRRLAPGLRELGDRRLAAMRPEDTATLIYTSGTTGEPKGVMLSHRNFLSNVEASLQVIPINGSDLHLSFLPLCHVFERMAGWYLLLRVGGTVAYAESMDTVAQNMVEVRPTIMLGVPRFFEKLYARIQDSLQHAPPLKRRLAAWALRLGRARLTPPRSPLAAWWLACRFAVARLIVLKPLHARLGGRLRFFVSGSAPLSRKIAEFFFGAGITILEGYGLTETSPVIAVNRLPVPRFGTVGPSIPGVEVKLAEDGEILTRGPHVMQGYYRKPEATAAVLKDGWLATGDIGRLDEAGHLIITDRKKDLIKTAGGKFVAPQKLEMLLIAEPAISQAFVYGDRRPYCVALIVPNMERLRQQAAALGVAGTEVAALVQDPRILEWYWGLVQAKQCELSGFEQVKKIALLDHELSQAAGELTPTLKAKRDTIATRYAGMLERLYAA